jgi:hypothetical protein
MQADRLRAGDGDGCRGERGDEREATETRGVAIRGGGLGYRYAV